MNDTTVDTIAALKRPIQQWTRGWMMTAACDALAKELGLDGGQQLWIVGRAGVLGGAAADVAAGGLAFLSPDLVRAAWNTLPGDLDPRQVTVRYSQLIDAWGDSELTRFGRQDLERLDELARRVINHAPASLGLVFAGWRAMPIPTGPGARVALTMHVLREMRGAAHITAVIATGLTPLQAVLASPAPPPRTGPEWAQHLGWSGPFDDPEPLRPARDDAEQLTNQILVPFFDALTRTELDELARLTVEIRNQIDM
jgi:hypothetical protein